MKAEHGDRACYWAGGTDLMLQWRGGFVDVDYCIDLTWAPELDFIESRDLSTESRRMEIGGLSCAFGHLTLISRHAPSEGRRQS